MQNGRDLASKKLLLQCTISPGNSIFNMFCLAAVLVMWNWCPLVEVVYTTVSMQGPMWWGCWTLLVHIGFCSDLVPSYLFKTSIGATHLHSPCDWPYRQGNFPLLSHFTFKVLVLISPVSGGCKFKFKPVYGFPSKIHILWFTHPTP